MHQHLALLIILLFSLTQCSTTTAPAASGTPSIPLVGTFTSNCYDSGDDYTKNTIVATATRITKTATYYSESDCSGAPIFKLEQVFDVSYGTADGSGVYPLDATVVSYSTTPLTSAYATVFNGITFCGLTTWAVDTSQSVLGLTCSGTLNPSAGAVALDIIKITGSSFNFSEEASISTRPTSLSTTITYS